MKLRDQFTVRQPEYLEFFEEFRDSTSLQQIADKVKEHVAKKGGSLRCLDSMAGTGIVGRQMKQVFDQIEMVYQDKSSKMLKADVYRDDDERITSDATEIGLSDDSFDIVLCRGGLNNVAKEDYPKILSEYIRILSADGIAILQDHFARTEEEKDVINRIKTEVTNIEGRNDATYVPTAQDLEALIEGEGGNVYDEQSFQIRLSMKDRFTAKGIHQPDLSKIKEILESQAHLQYEEMEDDIVIIYTILTVTFVKNSETKFQREGHEKAVERGWQFLESENEAGFFPSCIASTRSEASAVRATREIFSALVIADTLPKQSPHDELRRDSLQYIKEQAARSELLSFFEDQSLITPDTDTNSLGYSLLLENGLTTPEEANKILNSILEYTDENGKIRVWLSKERENHLDHVAATNAVYLAYLLGRENEVESTEEWITELLESEEYLEGSRYYHSSDSFLYFLGRLMKFPEVEKKLKAKLKKQLQKRMSVTNDPLDLAMRIILADMLGIPNEKEKQALLSIQQQNGSWPTDALYREGTKPRYFVNQSLPTSFALHALSTK